MLQASLGVHTKNKWHICTSPEPACDWNSLLVFHSSLPLKGGREMEKFDTFSLTVNLLSDLKTPVRNLKTPARNLCHVF